MNTIDLIICLMLVLAIWSGWRQGFIVQICSLGGIIAGIWLAARYGAEVGAWLHLDTQVAAAGGFVAVVVAVVVVVGVTARILRKGLHLAGFGIADTLLGIAVAVVKYLLIISVLLAAFEKLNTDFSLVGAQTIAQSKAYKPIRELSKKVVPYWDRIGEQWPQQTKKQDI